MPQETRSLQLEVRRNWEDLQALIPEWDELARRLGGDIYLSPGWAEIWWRHYGRGEIQVLLLRQPAEKRGESGKLVGVLPMLIERLWIGPVPVRLARLLGTDSTIVVVAPAIEPESEAGAYRKALHYLLGQEGCDLVSLGPLSLPASPAIPDLVDCPESRSWVVRKQIIRRGVHTTFELPQSFDDYLASLPKRQRGNLRRDLNQFNRLQDASWQVLSDPVAVVAAFEEFLDLHQRQWTELGRLGHFGDWPGSVAFSRELVRCLGSRGQVRIVRLAAEGKTLSLEWCFVYGRRCFWRLPARQSGQRWDRLGLGRVSMVRMVEGMIREGIRQIEAGPGHYEYKLNHGGIEFPLGSQLVVGPGLARALRADLLSGISRFLDVAYYRLWYQRLAPRLLLPRRPLRRYWMRTRL